MLGESSAVGHGWVHCRLALADRTHSDGPAVSAVQSAYTQLLRLHATALLRPGRVVALAGQQVLDRFALFKQFVERDLKLSLAKGIQGQTGDRMVVTLAVGRAGIAED